LTEGEETPIAAVYAGDFLSRVISKAPRGCVWLTIINNQNVAGVAVLADIAVIVLCEDVAPDNMLLAKAKQSGIALLSTTKSVYEACVLLSKHI
jgi:hypothetical protein